MAFLLLGGCIDLSQSPERECLPERRCGPSEASACGVDGIEYECAAIATCYGVDIDPSGGACGTPTQCEPVTCEIYCENGFETGPDGCEICACRDEEPQCQDVACRMYCENGFKTGSDGCEICECRDEEPQCGGVMCDLACENGFKTDENGCEICECREPANDTCDEDPCVAYQCADRRGQCAKESVLAASGACPAPDYSFWEPLPQCECGEDLCAPRECARDTDCVGDEALCVRTPNEDRSGYCVDAICDDLDDEYARAAQKYNSCTWDSDCQFYSPINDCCDGFAVNNRGAQELSTIDSFATRTSCGDEWTNDCALVDCAIPQPINIACIEGTCRMPR